MIIASEILNRWQPVAEQAGEQPASWREIWDVQLRQMDMAALQRLNAIAVGNAADIRLEYGKLVQAFRNELATRFMVGGQAGKMPAQLKLGSATNDLVFTPIAPCRVVDTRNVGGPISAGAIRNFVFYDVLVVGSSAFPGQGGSNGCAGSNFFGSTVPTAAAVTITVVSPSAAGNAPVWGGASPVPLTSVLAWSPGALLSGSTIVQGGRRLGTNPGGAIRDFAISYNGPSGDAQFVVDIVGYFIENKATALDCVTLTSSSSNCPGNASCSDGAPSCSSGYTKTGTFCDTSSFALHLTDVRETTCVAQNTDAASATLTASSRCCRVPGGFPAEP